MANHSYQVIISGTVKDLAGNELGEDVELNFTSIGDFSEPPRVVSISPANGATNVRHDASIEVEFSVDMDNDSLRLDTVATDNNIILERVGGEQIPLTYLDSNPGSSNSVYFIGYKEEDAFGNEELIPVDLEPNTLYQITVTANVRSDDLTPMDKDYISTFTTGEN